MLRVERSTRSCAMPVVEVAEETGSLVLRLPPRDLRRLGVLGGVCILAAFVFAGIIYAMNAWVGPRPAVEPSDFVIPVIVGLIGMLIGSLAVFGSRTEVRIDDGRI